VKFATVTSEVSQCTADVNVYLNEDTVTRMHL